MKKLSLRDWIIIIANVLLIGVAWGDIRGRVSNIEKQLGDGTPGKYMTIKEAIVLIKLSDERNVRILERLKGIEDRLHEIERKL